MSYKSGGDPVHESDFSDVLDVLAGRSPWKGYISKSLDIARKARKGTFRVLEGSKFHDATGFGTQTPGVTNKRTGNITMQEWGRPQFTYLLAALHECVHWVSSPAEQGAQNELSTAHGALGDGLLEGLVEVVTEDILGEQKIGLPSGGMRGHQERVPIVRRLIEATSVDFFARPLFLGELTRFISVMNSTYSQEGFGRIRALATAKMTKDALDSIENLSRQQRQRAAGQRP
jgi:hypothetical protein